jgi:nicotinamidase-related amidase
VAVDLAALVDPAHTAIVTQECQKGVIGTPAALPQLAEIAQRTMIPNVARLVAAARERQVPVLHAIAMRREDGLGSNTNARLFVGIRKSSVALLPGTAAVEVVDEIGQEPSDLVVTRLHGLGPWNGTDMDPLLRNLGVRTVIGVGVSVNVGIIDLAFDAVNAGYQFVLPRDAVAGIPEDYAETVIDNTLSLMSTVCTTDDILAAWP